MEKNEVAKLNEIAVINPADRINRLYKEAKLCYEKSLERILKMGELLIEEKAKLKHGEWILWVTANLVFGKDQAGIYMKIYNNKELVLNDERAHHLGERSLIKQIRSAETEIKNQQRVAEIEDLETSTVITAEGIYDVIINDPAWDYSDGKIGYTPDYWGGKTAMIYPPMTIDEIREDFLKIKTNENCILWLWTTNMFIDEAFSLIEDWDFRKVSILTWDKEVYATAYWLKSQTEHCIMAVKGKPPINNKNNRSTLIREKKREHSRKPIVFYELVKEICYGRIGELYPREEIQGIDQLIYNEGNKFNGDKNE